MNGTMLITTEMSGTTEIKKRLVGIAEGSGWKVLLNNVANDTKLEPVERANSLHVAAR